MAEPYPSASRNLNLHITKIWEISNSAKPVGRDSAHDGNSSADELVHSFLHHHTSLHANVDASTIMKLEEVLLAKISVALEHKSLDACINKILLINLAAEHHIASILRGEQSDVLIA